MKKIIIVAMLAALLLAAWVPGAASASSGAPVFTIASNNSATQGGSITIPITVSGNTGFAAVNLVVSYDPDVLEITGVTSAASGMPLNSYFALTSSPGTQWISLVNTSSTNWTGNGTVANVYFNVKHTATPGMSAIALSFTYSPDGRPATSGATVLWGASTISGGVNILAADNGGFIGNVPENPGSGGNPVVSGATTGSTPDGSSRAPAAGSASNDTTSSAGAPQSFGQPPQTGVPNIFLLALAAAACLIVTAVSWGRVLYIKRKEHGNS